LSKKLIASLSPLISHFQLFIYDFTPAFVLIISHKLFETKLSTAPSARGEIKIVPKM